MGRTYARWQDRAAYHLRIEPRVCADFLAVPRPGGRLVVATFGPDGRTTFSGPRSSAIPHAELADQFPGSRLVDTAGDDHLTPRGLPGSSPRY